MNITTLQLIGIAACVLAGISLFARPAAGQPREGDPPRLPPRTITVTGEAQSSARPDRAVVRLGTVAQAEQASAAQQQVNEVMEKAIEAIRNLGVAENAISTVGLSLHPVYAEGRPMPQQQPPEPRIVGYRAHNTIRVQLDDLTQVGPVIDAGVAAGANNVEGLSFELKDDTAARTTALRDAARQARAKADAIAEALGVRIEGVFEASEGVVQIMPRRMEMGRAMMAADAATPVQPGQVEVDATVTVSYRISGD